MDTSVLDQFGNDIQVGDTVVVISRSGHHMFAGRRGYVVSVDDSRFGVRAWIDDYEKVSFEPFKLHRLPRGYDEWIFTTQSSAS